MAAIAVRAIAAEACHLVVALVEHHYRDAKLRAYCHRVLKERGHFFWLGIRSHIPILGHASQRQVAHTTTS